MTRAAVVLATVLVGAAAARTGHAVEITSVALDRGGIHPAREGFDSDTLRVAFQTADPGADVTVTLTGLGEDRTLADVMQAPSPFLIEVTATTGDTTALAEGGYAVTISLTDGAGAADTTLAFLVDATPPVFRSFQLTGPDGSFANGDYVPLVAVMDEIIERFTLDVSEIDDAGDPASVLVAAHDDTTYGLLYRISPDNSTEDADDLPFRATAQDRFGNVASSEDVTICLSTFPPVFEAGHLVEAVLGDTLPDDTAFSGGDLVRLRTTFQTKFGVSKGGGAEQLLEFRVDLSDLDTEYQMFVNEAAFDTSFSDALLPGEALAPGYVHRIVAFHSYTLSEANRNQEGFYDGIVTALDQGCGETAMNPPYRIRLADLGPPAPTIDPPPETIVTVPSVHLEGTAPEAFRVRFALEDGTPLADAQYDTVTARFSADVPLDVGRNRIVAIATDAFDHDSEPSGVVEIFRIEEATLTVGPRVRPGDAIEVALLEPADRIDLDIFNLAGDRIWHDTTTSRSAVNTFTWSGRSRRGEPAQSGPYIARTTIHDSEGKKRVLNQAFVFTRK